MLNKVSTQIGRKLSYIKMACDFAVQAFEQRVFSAEEKLNVLRDHVSNLHQDFIMKEEKRLKLENQQLLSKVSLLKEKLLKAEQANGGKQLDIQKPLINQKESTQPNLRPANEETKHKQIEFVGKKQKVEKTKEKKQAKPENKQQGAPVDVSRLDMRVAQIKTVKYHPDADSLYVEEIDTGEECYRNVVTGLVKHVPIEQMQNRMVVLMCNLKPAKMRGVVSQAMVMCANCPEKVEIIDPPSGSVPGDRIVFEGYPGKPDAQLNPKKKVWERIQPDLHTNENYVACYKGVPFSVEGKGVCKVQTLANCGIK